MRLEKLSIPLDDAELERLGQLLLERLDDETSERIAKAGGDEGILGVSELDGFLTAVISGPNLIVPSTWYPAMWGAEQPVWDTVEQVKEIFGLIVRHQNSIARKLAHEPEGFEPLFAQREIEGNTYLIVDDWCFGYMRGIALDADAWESAEPELLQLLKPIRLFGTHEGFREVDKMSDHEQSRLQDEIPQTVRAIHKYWLQKRTPEPEPACRLSLAVGRDDSCPCGSGRKYKHCCLQ
jgi:uncharacterized protein